MHTSCRIACHMSHVSGYIRHEETVLLTSCELKLCLPTVLTGKLRNSVNCAVTVPCCVKVLTDNRKHELDDRSVRALPCHARGPIGAASAA